MKSRFLPLFLFMASSSALADICSGAVDRVQLTRGGNVEVISASLFGSTDGRTVCNVNTEWKGVGVGSCKGWYSLLLASIAQNTPVKIQYDSGIACTETGAWGNAPAPWMLSND
jgi:hypothetical protein